MDQIGELVDFTKKLIERESRDIKRNQSLLNEKVTTIKYKQDEIQVQLRHQVDRLIKRLDSTKVELLKELRAKH